MTLGLDDAFPIRQVLPVEPAHTGFCCWACCAWFFAIKKIYIMRNSLFTYNMTVYIRAGSQEWMDGVGWVWMTFPFQPISYLTITYVVEFLICTILDHILYLINELQH